MTSALHTKAQGLRVHKLANLGGLVALARLEYFEPAILLGAFLELREHLSRASIQKIDDLRSDGLQKLRERNAEKRAYQYSRNRSNTIEITLQLNDIKKFITKLGGRVPALEKDIVPEFNKLMR